MVGIGTTSVIPTASAAPGPGWNGALFEGRGEGRPEEMSAGQVEAGLNAVAQDCSSARYREAAAAVPKLISAAETRARLGKTEDTLLVARAYILATGVAVKERGDLSWITADRAVRAAKRAGHPLGHAMAARAQFTVLRQNGHHGWAQELARTTVSELAGEEPARPVVAHLLLEAAYGEAQAGRDSEATELLEHARDLARRGPSATTMWTDHAGPLTSDQVERYGLCVQHQLGNTEAALAHLAKIDVRAVATPERRARVRHDSAKLFRDLGDLPRALRLLCEQEVETPQDTRRTSVRFMVSGMLNTSPALPGLRPFAERIGAA